MLCLLQKRSQKEASCLNTLAYLEQNMKEKRSYPCSSNGPGSCIHFFCHNDQTLCIDASEEQGAGGTCRNVNDLENGESCKMKKILHQGKPHLCLFALKNIPVDVELRYDFGVTMCELFWRQENVTWLDLHNPPEGGDGKEITDCSEVELEIEVKKKREKTDVHMVPTAAAESTSKEAETSSEDSPTPQDSSAAVTGPASQPEAANPATTEKSVPPLVNKTGHQEGSATIQTLLLTASPSGYCTFSEVGDDQEGPKLAKSEPTSKKKKVDEDATSLEPLGDEFCTNNLMAVHLGFQEDLHLSSLVYQSARNLPM